MPLSGVTVLDLTRVLSGPFCTALLGDMGADVIKIEAPEGDSVRRSGTIRDGLSWYFAQFNRNKRSVRLDLRRPEAKAILARLIQRSDVLVENFRPGVLARMGFDDARLQALRPSLVICSINGFGSTGPYRDRPAFDFIAQAMSGFMSVNGGPDDPPMRSGLPISDLVAGLYAALSIAACVPRARATGPGSAGGGQPDQQPGQPAVLYRIHHVRHRRRAAAQRQRPSDRGAVRAVPDAGRGDRAGAPGRCVLRAAGGCAGRAGAERRSAVCHAGGAGGATAGGSTPSSAGKLAANTSAYWIETLNKAGVPCGPVNSVAEVFQDPQILAQEMVIDVAHPGHGIVRMLGFPDQAVGHALPGAASRAGSGRSIRTRCWPSSAIRQRNGRRCGGMG